MLFLIYDVSAIQSQDILSKDKKTKLKNKRLCKKLSFCCKIKYNQKARNIKE